MTRKRYDEHSTEMGLWLREQPELDSRLGYVATNLDYIWHNYKSGLWMLIEEKRHGCQVRRWQMSVFRILDYVARAHPRYRGLHIIVFENTGPHDGSITLDGQQITERQLVEFLRDFTMPEATK